ncbi:hypothetical protein [Dactylosporangium sp. CA-092794]|uniref:hypothetical protein n=1 Tax=Dactylosporangium sp. CA-092794 TaxID=3239929 RepID=UPI003D8FADFE
MPAGELHALAAQQPGQVSASIARLLDNGSVVTAPDPRDRRRTLVRPSAVAAGRLLVIIDAPAGDALRGALDDPAALPEVQGHLVERG